MRVFHILASSLACSMLASAASGVGSAGDIADIAEGYLVSRQDNAGSSDANNNNNDNNNGNNDQSNGSQNDGNSNQTGANSSRASNSADSTITPPPQSSNSNDSNNSSSNDGNSANDNASSGATKARSGGSTKTSLAAVDPQAPAGGLSMLTPAATAPSQYYKVGQTVTWVWNYTSLLRPPQHIDILASYASTAGIAVPSPFTLATNQSFDPTQTFIWDTGKYYSETSPLPIGTYTLVVYDADASGGVSQTPSPGHLGVWQQFPFGVYTPQPRVELANPYVCATCNSAASLERMTVGGMVAMAALTVSSFMWFSGAWRVST